MRRFGKKRYPSLRATRTWLLANPTHGYTIDGLRHYHYAYFCQNGIEDLTARLWAYGPPSYEDEEEEDEYQSEEEQAVEKAVQGLGDLSVATGTPSRLPVLQDPTRRGDWQQLVNSIEERCQKCPVVVWNEHTQSNTQVIEAQLDTFTSANFISWAQLKAIGMEKSLKTDKIDNVHHSDGRVSPAMGYVNLQYACMPTDDGRGKGKAPRLDFSKEPADLLVLRTSNHEFSIGSHVTTQRMAADVLASYPREWQEQLVAYHNSGANGVRQIEEM